MKQVEYYLQLKVSDDNFEELLFFSIPLLSKIVIEKNIYDKNVLLKDFTNKIFKETYGDYLYDSRPLLYSRLVKRLIEIQNEDPTKFIDIQSNFQEYISKSTLNKQGSSMFSGKGSSKNKGNKKVIDEWRSIIES